MPAKVPYGNIRKVVTAKDQVVSRTIVNAMKQKSPVQVTVNASAAGTSKIRWRRRIYGRTYPRSNNLYKSYRPRS